MNNNEKAAKFIAWVQKKKGFKTQDEAINYVKGLDEKGKESLAQQYAQANAQKAAHGAKLNYVNNLKHKCADDEELVYFKAGGKVGCGCVKKQGGGDISPEERKRIDAKAKAAREAEKNVGEGKGSNKTNRFTAAKIYKDRNTKMNYKNNPDEKEPPRINKGLHKNANGAKLCGGSKLKLKKKGGEVCPKCGKIHSAGVGCSVAAFKEKFEKGGSLNGISFYQAGTPEGGITERSDNTRVQRLPNNGEGVKETLSLGWQDYVPILSTLREARRLDTNDPDASKLGLAFSLAGDLAGAGMIGPVMKATSKYNKVAKTLKNNGFFRPADVGTQWIRIGKKTTPISAGKFGTIGTKTEPYVFTKNVPEVDVSGVALTPLVQALRVPAWNVAH